LLATAQRNEEGWCWAVQPGISSEVDPGLGWGTAAPTLFFVESYRTTGEERWLVAAQEASGWITARVDATAERWTGPDLCIGGCGLFTGIGGWAVVLDELAHAAGDERARILAGRVLGAIAARATPVDGGVHWHDLTEIAWGTAGIGCLMLTLGAEYLGPSAVELAVRSGEWLIAEAEEAPAGIRWSLGRAYEAKHPDPCPRSPRPSDPRQHGDALVQRRVSQRRAQPPSRDHLSPRSTGHRLDAAAFAPPPRW
jgi:hypothetical protein